MDFLIGLGLGVIITVVILTLLGIWVASVFENGIK